MCCSYDAQWNRNVPTHCSKRVIDHYTARNSRVGSEECGVTMFYTLKGDHEKIKKFIKPFIKEAKDEYAKQTKGYKKLPGVGGMLDFFEMGFYEEKNHIVLWDTNVSPPGVGLLWGRIAGKMAKNLEKYFDGKGIKVEAKAFRKKEDVR